jgi:hypothetical protein
MQQNEDHQIDQTYARIKKENSPLLSSKNDVETMYPHGGLLHPSRPYLKYIILFFVCSTLLGSFYSYDSIAVIATEILDVRSRFSFFQKFHWIFQTLEIESVHYCPKIVFESVWRVTTKPLDLQYNLLDVKEIVLEIDIEDHTNFLPGTTNITSWIWSAVLNVSYILSIWLNNFPGYNLPNVVLPIFGGVFLDRYGVRSGLMLYLILIALGTGFVAIAPYTSNVYAFMLFGRFVFGLGAESSYSK